MGFMVVMVVGPRPNSYFTQLTILQKPKRNKTLHHFCIIPLKQSQNSKTQNHSLRLCAATLTATASAMSLDSHIEKVLWAQDQILDRVSELATQITHDFQATTDGSPSPPIVVGVATGAFCFLADLVRKIQLPVAVDIVRAESYGSGTESTGAPQISLDLKLDVKDKHVIIVEDIVDTGNTLSSLIAHLKSKGASSVSVCAFLDKPARRKVNIELVGEGKFYRGFECPDYFVVGYGMDFAELYRNLPYVGVLKPEHYR